VGRGPPISLRNGRRREDDADLHGHRRIKGLQIGGDIFALLSVRELEAVTRHVH
jgi:DNA-directed RNA polymerase beta subunit